ncbi:M48 family metallopeptidase [Heyndrickxia acidicola]|uniref:M48 family metallopeptidase n=1 Tax=Heyndrickxia acidicola TaxID=209389 RepID=A0ABU6MDU1_9BACI|nr:M48 family metallopeptidase [Heyndrickxia acidicola]MED1202469.1 M48 family metallopeptidase [Heyndrickxia acidicola]
MKKWALRAIGVYILFGILMYVYLFHIASSTIPHSLKGTSMDPATFLTKRQLVLSQDYSRIRNLLFFLSTPYEWLFYFLILILGCSRAFEKWAVNTSRFQVIQSAVYLFWLSLVSFIATYPFGYVSYRFSKAYQMSNQTFGEWMKDQVIDFWVNYLLMFIVVAVLYGLMRKFKKRWWLPAWLLSIPFTITVMFVQPVVIDPLYNHFYPLQDKALETKILALANKAHIPANHVYEVDMSSKTNSLNAYVTGIGSNARIVLWDTTLKQLNDREILFIMAHEMGHYVEHHIYYGLAGYSLLTLLGLWLTANIMRWTIQKNNGRFKVSEVSNLSSLPLFLLITSVLLFAVSPITNGVSRYEETRADSYALKTTHDKKAAVQTFQDLTRSGLSQVNPPFLVKFFRYDHPTMLDRIHMVEQYPLKK